MEFALKYVNKPIDISEVRYKELPDNIKQNLSTLEEVADELKNLARSKN